MVNGDSILIVEQEREENLLLAVFILMHMHLGGMPTLAQSTAAVVD
jgi:hypothetical protein